MVARFGLIVKHYLASKIYIWHKVIKTSIGATFNVKTEICEVILGLPPFELFNEINTIKHFMKLNIKISDNDPLRYSLVRGVAKKKRDWRHRLRNTINHWESTLSQCGVACVLCLAAVLTQHRNYFCFYRAIGECDWLLAEKNCCAISDWVFVAIGVQLQNDDWAKNKH